MTRSRVTRAVDATFSVGFVHRVRHTLDLLDPSNPTLGDLVREGGELPRPALVFVDDGLLLARPDLPGRIEAWFDASGDVLRPAGPVVRVPGGEACKNSPDAVAAMLAAIDEAGLCRRSFVVVFGGGAVLDAVGWAAATAHRGIRLIRVPTTTLALSDSGVGVKNGVNLRGKKNFLGTFGVPWAVINDETFLSTLSERDWRAGFSEAIKVALLKEPELFERIVENADGIVRRDHAIAVPLLARSAELHLAHITEGGDPFETLSARPLDFGHWAAHKLEQLTDFRLRHGEAVAIGLAVDVAYAARIGRLPAADAEAVLTCLERIGFTLGDDALGDTEALMAGLEEFRQHLGGRLTITLIGGIGRPIDLHEIDADAMRVAIGDLARRQTVPKRAGAAGR